MLYEIKNASDKRLRRSPVWYGIIIHHSSTGNKKISTDSMWQKLTDNILSYLIKKDENYVSAHYMIDRRGIVSQLVDPAEYEAFHAGDSSWWLPSERKFVTDINKYAVGIELIGDGNLYDYAELQYLSLIELCKMLITLHPTIHPHCIVGHEMISIGRKVDPGINFNWRRLFKGIYK